MTKEEFNVFCQSLPHTTHVVQWGDADVSKIGGKVFAISGWAEEEPAFTFKTPDIAHEMLQEEPGLRPAPYLALWGMKWIENYAKPGLSDADLKLYLKIPIALFRWVWPRRNTESSG